MRKRVILLAVVLALGLAASACALPGQKVKTTPDLEQQLQEKDKEVQDLRSSMDQMKKDLESSRAEATRQAEAAAQVEATAKAEESDSRTAARATAPAVGGTELLPPSAKAGECYARVFIPPTYKTEPETILNREASERIEIVPAQYEWVQENVLVTEASERLEIVPAQYDWIEEKVLVKSEAIRLEDVPAQYEWVEEKVLVEPAAKVWKKGRGPIEKVDNGTGEIMCLVDVPAVYETVKKRVLKTPATTKKSKIPAEYKTVKKKVMTKPPTTRKVEIPAEYETVKVQRLVSPAEERRIALPAEYQTVTKQIQSTDGRMEWRPVLCETNITRDVISTIQRTLAGLGHDPGPIDGVYGRRTEAALREFQKDQNLSTGGVTLETMKKLDIEL